MKMILRSSGVLQTTKESIAHTKKEKVNNPRPKTIKNYMKSEFNLEGQKI